MTMPADAPVWLRDILTELARAQVRSEDRFAAVESQLVRLAIAQQTAYHLADATLLGRRPEANLESPPA